MHQKIVCAFLLEIDGSEGIIVNEEAMFLMPYAEKLCDIIT